MSEHTITEDPADQRPHEQLADGGETSGSPLLHQARDVVEAAKDYVRNHPDGGTADESAAAGEMLVTAAERTIEEHGSTTPEAVSAVVAVEAITVDDELDRRNRAENPITALVEDGHDAEAVSGVMALAEAGDTEVAERAAEDVDYAEALRRMIESNAESYKVFLVEPPPIPERTFGLSDEQWREVQVRLDDENSWHPARREVHAQVVDGFVAQAERLSSRLMEANAEPTIFALRGTCGSGKTMALRSGHPMFRGILDEHGEPSGSIAPDAIKSVLLEDEGITHTQVHDESSVLGRRVEKALRKPGVSMVYDKLMNYPGNIADTFANAAETGRKVKMLDMDVPLELSAARVLTREKGGPDPNIAFRGVADAFVGIRRNRRELFKQLEEHSDRVGGYVLMGYDFESKNAVEAARFDNGKVTIAPGREGIVSEAAPADSSLIEQDVDVVEKQVISQEYIDYFIGTYFGEGSERHAAKMTAVLQGYMGKTLAEALDIKAGAVK